MSVELVVGSDDASLGRGQLSATVDNIADGAQWSGLCGCGSHNVHAQFGCGVGPPCGHHRVYGATKRRIEQGCIPSAMHAAHRVEMLDLRYPLKDSLADIDLDQRKVQRVSDVRIGELTGKHGLHQLQPRHSRRHCWRGDTRFSSALKHRCANDFQLLVPKS